MTNYSNPVLYTGFTSKLKQRVWEHKEKLVKGFTSKYNVNKLVYYESDSDYEGVLAREKQIKAGSRKDKTTLIEKMNPKWEDLYNSLE